MTELEKIEYARSFIDKLANGINPLDDTPVPDGDVVNNVRLSRCFFYVSGILQNVADRERKRESKANRYEKAPFSITFEQLQGFEYTDFPISATVMARKINALVKDDIDQRRMKPLSYRNINHWLKAIGMIEWRKWDDGKSKRFPTEAGEGVGLVLQIWENYGRSTPVIYFSEKAQHFIIDNIDAVIAAAERGADEAHQDDEEMGAEE